MKKRNLEKLLANTQQVLGGTQALVFSIHAELEQTKRESANKDKTIVNLEHRVRFLEQQLERKDKEIEILRDDLAHEERKNDDLTHDVSELKHRITEQQKCSGAPF